MFVCSPPFIYLFSHVLISVLTQMFILYYNPLLLYFILQPKPVFAPGSSFNWLLYAFAIPPNILGAFLSTSLLFSTTRFSRLTLCISCPNPGIGYFSKEPSSFYWRLVLDTEIWALCVLAMGRWVGGVLLFVDPLSWQQGHTCVYGVNLFCV